MHAHTYRHTDIQIYRYTDIQIYRYTDIQTYIPTKQAPMKQMKTGFHSLQKTGPYHPTRGHRSLPEERPGALEVAT